MEKQKKGLLDFLLDDSWSGNDSAENSFQGGGTLSQLAYLFEKLTQAAKVVRGSSLQGSEMSSSVPGLYWIWGGAVPQ